MEIIDVPVQGFCGGVRRAQQIAMQCAADHPKERITILGYLVHNSYVNAQLEEAGIHILEAKGKTRLELLDQIDDGIVIFTAHGVNNAVRQKAKEKGLTCIDASCPFVLATQKLIADKRNEGFTIFYIGKKGHPEAEGAMEQPEGFYLIEKEDDIPEGINGPIFVTNQTTMSIQDLQTLFEAIRQKYPEAEFCSELCTATRKRQEAVLALENQNIDLLIVIGDPASNNTRKLSSTGKQAGIPQVIQIEDAAGLDQQSFEGINRVAITSGASTPEFLKNEVLNRLQQIQSVMKQAS